MKCQLSKEIGITAKKKENFSEWYTQVVIKAELADYAPVKGLIVLRPDGYSIWESIRNSMDEKLKIKQHKMYRIKFIISPLIFVDGVY